MNYESDQICYHITLIQFIIFFDADFHHSIIFYSFVLFEKKKHFQISFNIFSCMMYAKEIFVMCRMTVHGLSSLFHNVFFIVVLIPLVQYAYSRRFWHSDEYTFWCMSWDFWFFFQWDSINYYYYLSFFWWLYALGEFAAQSINYYTLQIICFFYQPKGSVSAKFSKSLRSSIIANFRD